METVGIQELTRSRHPLLWQALAVSAALHLCAAWWLRQMEGASLRVPFPAPLELRVLPPKLAPAQFPKAERATEHANAGRRRAADEWETPPSAPIAAPAASGAPTVQLPGTPASGLSESARRSAGAVDREMRQSGAARAGGNMQMGRPATALERGIAAAGLPRGITTQDVVAPDGRLMTKVITPSGTYCVWGRRPGAGFTESDLAALTTTTCP